MHAFRIGLGTRQNDLAYTVFELLRRRSLATKQA